MCYYFRWRCLFLLSLPRMFVAHLKTQSRQIYSAVSLPLSTHLGNTTNSTQGFRLPHLFRHRRDKQTSIRHIHTTGLRSRALSLGPAFKAESSECWLPPIMDRDEEGMYSCLTSTSKRRKPEARKAKVPVYNHTSRFTDRRHVFSHALMCLYIFCISLHWPPQPWIFKVLYVIKSHC